MKYNLQQRVFTLDEGKLVQMYILCRRMEEFHGTEQDTRHNIRQYWLHRRLCPFGEVRNRASCIARLEHELYATIDEATQAIFGGLK